MFRRNRYVQKRWRGDDVLIRTDNGCLNIQYNKNKNVLEFYSDELGTKPFENMQQLINTLQTETQTIYLDWVQQNGAYYYFNLAKVIQQTGNHHSLDIGILNISQNNANISEDSYFDETVSIDKKLSVTDILIISPLKCMNMGYTDMGTYNKHKLFLGRLPTEEFIKANKIIYLMNCCNRTNDESITNLCEERHFKVTKWQWKTKSKKYSFTPLISQIKSEEKDEKSENELKESEIKMNGKEYLNAMIDEIEQFISKGNILIHCLAGAHRSPFVTACYLSKHGGFQNKTAQQIYTFMKNRRNVVQELGFDADLKKYQKFLLPKQSDTNISVKNTQDCK